MLKVVVIGLGRFGATVAADLTRRGAEVLAIDRNIRLVEEVVDRVTVAVGLDGADRQNLEAYDVGTMDAAVVAVGTNFEASVLVTMHCKALGVRTVYAKALTALQAEVLQKVGADHIVRPEEDMGLRLAQFLVDEKAVEFVDLPEGYALRRLDVPAAWVGRSLAELKLMGEQRLGIIQIVRAADAEGNRRREPLPHGAAVLQAGDQVDAIGRGADLDRFS